MTVQAEVFFQFLNPLVFLLFAAGFFGIHAMRPTMSVFLFALSYLCGAAAFANDILDQAGIHLIGGIAITELYAMTATLFSAAITLRYRGRAPWRLFGAVFLAHMSLYGWIYLNLGPGWTSSIAANFGCGVIFALGVILIRGRTQGKIDKAVFWLYVIGSVQCFVRPLALAYAVGGVNAQTYDLSLFLTVLQIVVGLCALMLGTALLVSLSREIFSDLEQQSVTDRLSGILNRRGFEVAAENSIRASAGAQAVESLLLVDIDHFKQVNDTLGHTLGDMVIAEMGALLRQYSDHDRFAGRIGGEEFAVFVIGEPLHSARALAEAIRRDFAALRIDTGDPALREYAFSASFGVAQRQPGETLASLLSRADEALYIAKENGRNQVICETDAMVYKLRNISRARPHESYARRAFRNANMARQAG